MFLFYVFREVNKEPERLDGINMLMPYMWTLVFTCVEVRVTT